MAPVLIDQRGLLKLGFISVLTAAFVFATGFVLGHQRAEIFYQAGSEIEQLSLPLKAVVADYDIEPQVPENTQAGEEIDVDQAEKRAEKPVKQPGKQHGQQPDTLVELKAASSSDAINKKPAHKVQTTLVSTDKKPVLTAAETPPAGQAENKKIKTAATAIATAKASAKKVVQLKSAASTAEKLTDIKYSIQVGMYSRRLNAENMVKMLQAQQLDAYVSDFSNKEKQTRYNVRFGYFADKKSATAALKDYRNSHKGDGYLVSVLLKNRVPKNRAKVADSSDVKQPDTVETKEKSLRPVTPPAEAISVETAQDKVSQADILSSPRTVTDSQLTTVTN